MKQHLLWLLGSTLVLGLSFTPAEAQLLDRLFGPPPPPFEELPPPRLRGNPYAYERVIPEEAYPEDPEAYTEDPRRSYNFRERREAAPQVTPQEGRRDRAKRAGRESQEAPPSESREEPPRKSSAKVPPRREAEEAVSEAKQQEDAQKALHHVELARTYFLQNPPPEGTEERAKVGVIAGQAFPEDLKMTPLPGEIAFEVSAACPANYFAWGYDIVLADSCTRRAIAIIGMDGPQQSAGGDDAAKAAERDDDAAPGAPERPAAAAATLEGAPAAEADSDLSRREVGRENTEPSARESRQGEDRTGAVSTDADSPDRKDEAKAKQPAAAEAASLPRERADTADEEEPKSQTRPTPQRADTRQDENRQGS